MHLRFRSFLWISHGQAGMMFPIQYWTGTSQGWWGWRRGRWAAWGFYCLGWVWGTEDRPVFSVLLVAGSGKPRGKSIEPWISRIPRQLHAEMQLHFLSDLSPALTSPLSSMLVCLSSCLLDMSTWMGFNKPKIKLFLLTINRKQQLLILLEQKQNREWACILKVSFIY